MVKGDSIASNRNIKSANIIDLAPTILHILDVPMHLYIDGKVLKDIFKKGSSLYHKKIKVSNTFITSKKHKKSFTEEEEAMIKERLRGLGYI
jgi:hypothetical protein